eukprot:3463771-Pyramimonas_sp.AAC.1
MEPFSTCADACKRTLASELRLTVSDGGACTGEDGDQVLFVFGLALGHRSDTPLEHRVEERGPGD